ncbi:MAG: right-handed parallel beta-helix repeat-containing protein [Usitatibacter sp.]
MRQRVKVLAALAFFAAIGAMPAAAVQRAFVASYGSDANVATNCGFTRPCRSFNSALPVVDPGGELLALDAAGYGPVVITKSVTITANPGVYAGIAASSGNAVTITGTGIDVILRYLSINSLGADKGIAMTAGASLTVENCVISAFNLNGVFVSAPALVRILDSKVIGGVDGLYVQGGAALDVTRSTFRGSQQAGVHVNGSIAGPTTNGTVIDSVSTGNAVGFLAFADTAGGNARLAVTRSAASNNTYGVWVYNTNGGTARATVSGSIVTNNNEGLRNGVTPNAGTLESQGNNTVSQNVLNTNGTITPLAGI